MPDAAGHAARRRDAMLARTRRVSLCIAASAAAASIGLGAAFARELPGHHALTASVQPGSVRAATPGTQPAPAGNAPAQQSSAAPRPAQPLAQPPQAPAPAQTVPAQTGPAQTVPAQTGPAQTVPPHATSGGS